MTTHDAVSSVLAEKNGTSFQPTGLDTHTTRLTGFRKFRALLVAVPALVAAACGVGTAPTPGATSMHTEGPTATVPGGESPTPFQASTATVPPTEVVTATPTEKATPAGSFNAESFLADLQKGGSALDKYKTPKVTLDQLTAAYNDLLASPAAPTAKGFQNAWKDCSNTKADMDAREGACLSVTDYALKAIHSNPDSAQAETFGKAVAGYDLGSIYTNADRLAFITQGVSQLISTGY